MIGTINECSRCGLDHVSVTFKKFERPIAPPEFRGWAWQYWAPCPTNGDPVLVHVATDDNHNELPMTEEPVFGPPGALK